MNEIVVLPTRSFQKLASKLLDESELNGLVEYVANFPESAQFTRFGFSLSAIRHWEANRRTSEGAARVLLMLIDKNPDLVLQTLEAA
jgi:hypothetical protein